jgi:hypothetical protein
MANKLSSISLVLSAISLSACGVQEYSHKSVYEVDPILEPYISAFEQRAFEQQQSIEVKDIKVYFVEDLGEDEDSVTLAVCKRYETKDGRVMASPEIEVDKQEFDRLTELRKEALMFHELGHCILGRDHNDSLLPEEENRHSSIMSTYLLSTYFYAKYYNSYVYELFHNR